MKTKAIPGAIPIDDLLRSMLDALPDAHVTVDLDGRIALVNALAEKMFGYMHDELVGQPVEILLPERMRGRHVSLRQAFQLKPRQRAMGSALELMALRKDGSEFSVDIMLAPMPEHYGGLVSASIRDISDLKEYSERMGAKLDERNIALTQAMERLKASEERFRNVVEQAADGIVILSVSARCEDANACWTRMTGYTREEMMGKNLRTIVSDSEHGDLPIEFGRMLEGSNVRKEWEILRKDGSKLPVEVCSTRMTDGYVLAIVRDASDRKQSEAALRNRAAELERFHHMSVGRELRMIELKKQVNELATMAGQPAPYDLSFLDELSSKMPLSHE